MLTAVGNGLWSGFRFLMAHLFFVNIILSLVIVFFQRRSPKTVWAWLLLLYFLPLLGFVLYLVVGQDFHKSRLFKGKEVEEAVRYAADRQEERICRQQLCAVRPELHRFRRQILYNLEAGASVLTDNNAVEIYTDGSAFYEALRREMERAERYIHLQSYIIRRDEVWEQIEKVLEKKATEGVEVRVLFDSMGCRTMRRTDWKRLEDKGIRTAEFFPALFGRLQLRPNYRNHRKITVIDGSVGFVGGFNIGREYTGADPAFGYWRDTHLCIEGAAVTTLAVRFVMDWNYAAGENLFLEDRLFEIGTYRKEGKDSVQIISSGPDSAIRTIHDNYVSLIYNARSHVYLQTPYLVPDDSVLDALKTAARSGIDVRIMVPCKPDHPFVYWATYSYLGELVAAGAKCYFYQNGFLHAKMLTADGLAGSVGTANMDIRSFELNFEVNAVIYSAETVGCLEKVFKKDLENCTELTEEHYAGRGYGIRIKEQVSRLLSPVL